MCYISLYLAKAFDCVPHELLLAMLKAYREAEHGVALLRNYLSGRSHRVRSRRQVFFLGAGYETEGVPQGSVPVGPLFFNVFTSGNESVSMLMLTMNKFMPRIKIQ